MYIHLQNQLKQLLHTPTIMKYKAKSASVSNLQILQVISDQICTNMLNAIAKDTTNSQNLMKLLNLTRKQYYDRSSRLLKIGLISRNNGEIILTSLGRLVYRTQSKIASAISQSSELSMIDAIKSTAGIPDDEQEEIIDKLIDDPEIKMLIT